MTRNLKIMAKELNVPIIVLSQLARSAEKRMISDLCCQTCVIQVLSNRMRI